MPGFANGNGEPPPSTLAAQIVQNLETAEARPSGDARAHLQELLQMILEGEESNGASQRAFDDTLEENYRLICVIVKACLNPLHSDDPFEDYNALRAQAKDSLDVVDLTIRRSPEVLFQVPAGRISNASPGGPLFLWLIPHLVKLANTDDVTLSNCIEKVLETAFTVQKRAAATKFRRLPVLRYIKGCIRDILSHAKNCAESPQLVSNFQGRIPSNDTLAETCFGEYGLEHTSTIQFRYNEQYLLVASNLCRTVAVLSMPDLLKKPARVASSNLSWVVDCVLSIWNLCISVHFWAKTSTPAVTKSLLEALRPSLAVFSLSKHEFVMCSRTGLLLCNILKKALQLLHERPNAPTELAVCWGIVDLLNNGIKTPIVLQYYYEVLNSTIESIVTDQKPLKAYGQDLQRILVIVSQTMNHHDTHVPEQLLSFKAEDLRLAVVKLVEAKRDEPDGIERSSQRPRKKIRGFTTERAKKEPYTIHTFHRAIYDIVQVPFDPNHDSIELASETFKILGETEQNSLFVTLGRAACRSAEGIAIDAKCPYCDFGTREASTKTFIEIDLGMVVYNALTKLLRMAQDLKTSRPRVAAMIAIRRLLNHSNDKGLFDIRETALGTWCCSSLKSSIRDLRLSAVSTIGLFIEDSLDQDTLNKNRPIVLDSLRSLAEKNDPTLHETCILGFGQFASCTRSEEEVNIALVRLVEYLGNSNPFVSGIAVEELLKICKYDSVHAQQLFTPYWRTISVVIAMNLQKRPQIAQSICDILGIHVSELLRRTQFCTIPYLVLTKQRDTLQRIAVATGPDQTIFSICIPKPQLAAILAYLLVKSTGDTEKFVRSLLINASLEFENHDLSELLKTNSIYTAFELLKIAGEPDPTSKARAIQIIHFLAETTQRKPGSSRNSSSKKQDVIASFFETWALAIIQLLSEIISQAKGVQPIAERRRCVVAIQEMAMLAGNKLANTLPQICSCLRSAIEDRNLCNEALSAWMSLLKTLDEDQIAELVDPTFAILAEHWESFNHATHQEAYNVVDMLFKEHKTMVQKIVETIPSITSIPLLSKFAAEVEKFKRAMDPKHQLQTFAERCQSENDTVVLRALNELEDFLSAHQSFFQTSATNEQPDLVIGGLVRSLLDVCVKFKDSNSDLALRCARCLGLTGCIDPTKIEAAREDPEIFVLSNFSQSSETIDFIIFFLREVLVKSYLATTVTSRQQLLAFGMQELLKVCDFDASVTFRRDPDELYKKWISLPESTRNTLTPFLSSKYTINPMALQPDRTYPLYHGKMNSSQWLRTLVLDLLQKGRGDNACLVFDICKRLVRNQDIAIATFLLPYVMLNVIVEGTDQHRADVVRELYAVLAQPLSDLDQTNRESLIICSQNVFRTIDYLSRWIQEKEKSLIKEKSKNERRTEVAKVDIVWAVIRKIPPKVISRRAIECKSFARALFHWEQYIREQEEEHEEAHELYEQLQEIYMQIDEPDGIEGISSCIHSLTMEQQVLEDRKAGRWMAVQNWYEVELENKPSDGDVQWNLLTSLRESGQHDVLLNQISNFKFPELTGSTWRPFAMEASWVTGNWNKLREYYEQTSDVEQANFNVGVGAAISFLARSDYSRAGLIIQQLLLDGTRALSATNTSSIQTCHDTLLKFHVLIELEAISGAGSRGLEKSSVRSSLDQRLETLGAFSSYKQYLLGVRRAAMQLSKINATPLDISSTWLASAKLARKENYLHQAFNAVLHASQLHDTSATIEHARLTWHNGYHRKAIQSLKGAIDANAFQADDPMDVDSHLRQGAQSTPAHYSMVAARAQLLLAKWIDGAGQTQSTEIVAYYRKVTSIHTRWDKGFYYLAKHYNKLIESERSNPIEKQARTYLEGDLTKLCIENFLRSLPWGSKYLYQSLPKILTLWLDFGAEVENPVPYNLPRGMHREEIFQQRRKVFKAVQSQMKKYIDRLPAYIFYTAFAQIVARICHPNKDVYSQLVELVAKVVAKHPQQAIWPLLAMMNSKSSPDRAQRGIQCKTKTIEIAKRTGGDASKAEILNLLNDGANVSKQLLQICNRTFEGSHAPKGPMSLSRDIAFNHSKAAPCRLVIPIEAALLANLPPASEGSVRNHSPFSKDAITISVFLDEFAVLNSLIRPRKIRIRGSDGNVYTLMCKPKDDLRKDQRLLEFNSMISRTLKKDAECSKRRLYIRTYAVTPLNEEHGLIEWVDGLRTLRDIFIQSYNEKGIRIDYGHIRNQLNAVAADQSQLAIFTDDVLGTFRPVLHEWFVNMFPEPSAWLAARLRYTRSCAVMSIVGHVLGLGDRHGENILLEEAKGGTFHVDFNCLFDKGKTFDTPERVPFRLTHNMVDAFGVYKENGPFRKSCELTLGILRQYEDTLMTILETFLYDPTTDFIGKKRRNHNHDVPDTPEGVLDSVRRKVRGLPEGESVPLSQEGYVQLQIDQARDPWNLARMYIGWCPFF